MYSEKIKKMLQKAGINEGDEIEASGLLRRLHYDEESNPEREKVTFKGILLPSPSFSSEDTIVVKLKNGYNISIIPDGKIKLVKKGIGIGKKSMESKYKNVKGEKVVILGTGGTIASFVEYKTGAVYPAVTPSDFLDAYPSISKICNIEPRIIFSILSEDVTPLHWLKIAEEIKKAFSSGAKGVVVAHGTDTMGYTAAALSFLLDNLPGPVVLVGSQRSSDRPSTDAALNVTSAVKLAANGIPQEVVAVMHGSTSDNYCLILRGVRLRKMHTSRRDAFQSISEPPLGIIEGDRIYLRNSIKKNTSTQVIINGTFEKNVHLIQATPTLTPSILDFLLENSAGIVLTGTGLGHVKGELISTIKNWVDKGKPVVISSQCISGRVNLNVYSTGRMLFKSGVISAGDMVPEVAYVKLMWVLGRTKELAEIRKLMGKNLKGELTTSSSPFGYGEEYFERIKQMRKGE